MNKRNYYLYGSAFIIFLIALFLYRTSLKRMNEFLSWVNHSQNVIISFERLSSGIKSAQTLPSDEGILHRNALLELYKKHIQNIPTDILRLRTLVKDNPLQQRRLDTLSAVVRSQRAWMLNQDFYVARTEEASRNYFENILLTHRLIERGIESEQVLLERRKIIFQRTLSRMNVLTVIAITVASFLIIGISITNVVQVKKRKKAELFLESILNTTPNGIITFEAVRNNNDVLDLVAVFANNTVEEKIGIPSGEVIGQSLNSVFPDMNDVGIFNRFKQVLETGKKDDFELLYQANNRNKWFRMRLAKMNDGVNLLFADISNLKEYEHQLSSKVALLQSSNKELEQFAFVASHDLQEPLRKIRTYSGIVMERGSANPPDFSKNYMVKISEASDRMGKLINDLLNLSDLSTNKPAHVMIDLNNVLQNVLNDVELVIEEKQAVIKSDNLATIEAIPLQMNQLFYNLVSNSLKFTKPGQVPELNIISSPVSREEIEIFHLNNQVEFTKIVFEDNGIGFEGQYAEKIFEIFQRLNTRHEYAGSGIGLALCRKIVVNHHGFIIAESRQKQGASFQVILPLKQPLNIS